MKAIIDNIRAELARAENIKQRDIEAKRRSDVETAAGGRPIKATRVERWIKHGWTTCPDTGDRLTCDDPSCAAGARCHRLGSRGLFGDGSVMPKKMRPLCGATTRRGSSCNMTVEPGTKRCRLHGGLSTGPKTYEGKARVAAAARARWERYRATKSERES